MRKHVCVSVWIVCSLAAGVAGAARLKDLVTIEGVRDNQLIGYGVVVGLAGTGDTQQTVFSNQSLANILERMGVAVLPTAIRVKNTASVMVTATLPAFAQPGMKIDITAAAVGDALNLQGGILILTSLRGADGLVYAVAQGPIVTGGFAPRSTAAAPTINHPTVGRSPNGAMVERPAPSIEPKSLVHLQLRQYDYTTATRIVGAINKNFAGPMATARTENAGLIAVAIPAAFSTRSTEFLAELENLSVEADLPARVVINERTGTIVLGKDVRIAPMAILHGKVSVEIQTGPAVAQPEPLPQAATQTAPPAAAGAKEEKPRNVVLKQGATVEELVRALAAVGSNPRDVIAILQALHAAGALEADIEVI
jgi:flagellar P-ring protein precursor FlgI